MVQSGLFAKTPYKAIETCLQRMHTLHCTRLIVAHHGLDNSFFHLRAAIRRGCKGAGMRVMLCLLYICYVYNILYPLHGRYMTGPSCLKAKRDNTLPCWWTAYYDVALLQAVLETSSPSIQAPTATSAGTIEETQSSSESPDEGAVIMSDEPKVDGGGDDAVGAPSEAMMATSAAVKKECQGINWLLVSAHASLNKPADFKPPIDRSQGMPITVLLC